jgi:hypothetical protein
MQFYDRLLQRGYSKTYLDPLFKPTLNRNTILDQVINSKAGKRGLYIHSTRLYIIVLLPKLDTPLSFRDFFRLPPEVLSNPDFIKVYGDQHLVVGRQTFKNIGRLLAYKPINTSKSTDSLTGASG